MWSLVPGAIKPCYATAAVVVFITRRTMSCTEVLLHLRIPVDILHENSLRSEDACSVVFMCNVLCLRHLKYFTLDAGLLARSQYSEGPATGHLDTGFSWFPCVYKQMLRFFPRFQVATTCFSCSPPDLNLLVNNFIFCIHVK